MTANTRTGLAPGIYVHGGVVFHVRERQNGTGAYALRFDPATSKFEYDKNADDIARLDPKERIA